MSDSAGGPVRSTRSTLVMLESPLPGHRVSAPPVPLTLLIGRATELASAADLVRRDGARLLTLTGAGGVGKTRLGLQLAADLAPAFPDGVVWVPLAAVRDQTQVLPAIIQAIGASESSHRSPLETLTQALRGVRLLLLLDNFEQVLAARGDLARLLAASAGIVVIVTSRIRLRVSGEHVLVVPPLRLPVPEDAAFPERVAPIEAARLFVARVRAVMPAFVLDERTAPLIVDMCHRLDGVPLAIELAAARAYHLSLSEIRDQLDSGLRVLSGGAAEEPARLRSMWEAVAWSHDLLAPTERAIFRRLTVFAGGFTLLAAEHVLRDGGWGTGDDGVTPSTRLQSRVAHVPSPSVLDLLSLLIDQSLIQYDPAAPGGPRYGLLEPIREFAAEQLALHSGEVREAGERHADFYLALAESAEPELSRPAAQVWLDRLEVEHDNLRAALTWLEASGRWLDLLRFTTTLTRFWDSHGHLSEGRQWLARALGSDRVGTSPPELRAAAMVGLGFLDLRLGAYDDATVHLEAARTLRERSGDAPGLAEVTQLLGSVAEYRGDEALADVRYQEALVIARAAGDLLGVAAALDNLAGVSYRRGDFEASTALALEALAAGRVAGPAVRVVMALISVGQAAAACGDLRGAAEAYGESLSQSLDLGYFLGVADTLPGVVGVALAIGTDERAARILGAAEALAERLGVPRLPHDGLYRCADIAARTVLGPEAFTEARTAGWSVPLDATLTEARAVLDEVIRPVATVAAPSASLSLLTRREFDVLRLLVAGHTDRDIGEALFISSRTVESHLRRIFGKLEVHSRLGATMAAMATGLIAPPTPALPDHEHDS